MAINTQNSSIVIGGDFNFPGLDWSDPGDSQLNPGAPNPSLHRLFLEMIHDMRVEQLVDRPTREKNTLDLFLTNLPSRVPRVEVMPGISDRCIPYIKLDLNPPKKQPVQRCSVTRKEDPDVPCLPKTQTDRNAAPYQSEKRAS
ncbi:hypothetical protein ACOMHN_010612 [Nucella lapillus]